MLIKVGYTGGHGKKERPKAAIYGNGLSPGF
jgi:hypothetical protein